MFKKSPPVALYEKFTEIPLWKWFGTTTGMIWNLHSLTFQVEVFPSRILHFDTLICWVLPTRKVQTFSACSLQIPILTKSWKSPTMDRRSVYMSMGSWIVKLLSINPICCFMKPPQAPDLFCLKQHSHPYPQQLPLRSASRISGVLRLFHHQLQENTFLKWPVTNIAFMIIYANVGTYKRISK